LKRSNRSGSPRRPTRRRADASSCRIRKSCTDLQNPLEQHERNRGSAESGHRRIGMRRDRGSPPCRRRLATSFGTLVTGDRAPNVDARTAR
jgi:hypothetical protein